jgi:hypothetical protein
VDVDGCSVKCCWQWDPGNCSETVECESRLDE